MKKAEIFTIGDRSVGIPGSQFVFDFQYDELKSDAIGAEQDKEGWWNYIAYPV